LGKVVPAEEAAAETPDTGVNFRVQFFRDYSRAACAEFYRRRRIEAPGKEAGDGVEFQPGSGGPQLGFMNIEIIFRYNWIFKEIYLLPGRSPLQLLRVHRR
jgi:hypothetical protein